MESPHFLLCAVAKKAQMVYFYGLSQLKGPFLPQHKPSLRIPQHKIDEVRDRVSLTEVVRGHVPLKRKGRDLWGCCPFHQESTPSFQVREREGYYHCFGCGAHGSAIDFVMQIQGLTFPDAVEKLASLAGVVLERTQVNPQEQKKRFDGLEALERATVWFEQGLKGAPRDYFLKRGLSQETLQTFRLGYAPDDWRALKHHLQAEGFGEETLLEAALVRKSDRQSSGNQGETYDTFRNRVMFPILNMQGKPVAFGGRVLDASEPKYLNSPQSNFFNKSHLLYGLYHAAPHIRRENTALLVEGYMDVIALYEAGIKTAVAPMGTAVTEDQVALLWRYHDMPTVCLDGDAAGQQAGIRLAFRVLGVLQAGKGLQFAMMPDGHDPDTYVQKFGKEAFLALLSQSRTLEDVLWQDLVKGENLSTGQGRAAVEKNISEMVKQIKDETMAKHILGALRDRMWQQIKDARYVKTSGGKYAKSAQTAWTDASVMTEHGAGSVQQILLALVFYRPEILADISEEFAQLEFSEEAQARAQEKLFTILSPQGVETEKWDTYLLNSSAKEDVKKHIAKFEPGKLLADMGISTTAEISTFWKKLFNDYRRTGRRKSATKSLIGDVEQDITKNLEAWRKFKAAKTRGIVPPSETDG